MVTLTQTYGCKCEKCGYEFTCQILPKRCPSSKCRSWRWNRDGERVGVRTDPAVGEFQDYHDVRVEAR